MTSASLTSHPKTGAPLSRLLTDDLFRKRMTKGINDPVVRAFWEREFESYPKVFRAETISPIQNKVGQFLSNPLIRNIVGQTRTKFDLLNVMDKGGILLMNLSKGRIGEDNASLLGSLMVTQLYLAALRRANTQEDQRRDFYLYVDELQSVATEDFASMLSESRKYRLNIAGMANQHLSQLPDALASSILGNIGTLITFNVGSEDAKILEEEFQGKFRKGDFQTLPRYNFYAKLSIDGTSSEGFSGETLHVPVRSSVTNGSKIIAQSRIRFAIRQDNVGSRTRKWVVQ